MLEKRFWSNIIYILLGFLICMAILQINLNPSSSSSNLSYYTTNTVYQLNTNSSSGFTCPLHTLPASDYSQLIDLDFEFSILNLACNISSPLLLVLVHSSPQNYAKRKVIRETWGKNEHNLKVLFMLGVNETLQDELDEENRVHNDFVQGNFSDTYRNLTYKHVMVFKYVIYHCPQAKYVLKTDDDVFVNMPTMKNFLTIDLSPHGASNMLFCTPRENIRPSRTYRSKWRVSFTEYPKKIYPTYCPGWTLLYSPDVIFALYKEAQNAEYFWIDDVHITGILAEKLGIIQSDIEPLVMSAKNFRNLLEYSHNISQPFLYGRPDMKAKHIRSLWNFTLHHPAPRSVLKVLHEGT